LSGTQNQQASTQPFKLAEPSQQAIDLEKAQFERAWSAAKDGTDAPKDRTDAPDKVDRADGADETAANEIKDTDSELDLEDEDGERGEPVKEELVKEEKADLFLPRPDMPIHHHDPSRAMERVGKVMGQLLGGGDGGAIRVGCGTVGF
jgi:hypothetical protein